MLSNAKVVVCMVCVLRINFKSCKKCIQHKKKASKCLKKCIRNHFIFKEYSRSSSGEYGLCVAGDFCRRIMHVEDVSWNKIHIKMQTIFLEKDSYPPLLMGTRRESAEFDERLFA